MISIFQGVGIAYMVLNGLVCIYYNVIISWALTLFFSSFYNPLPWSRQRTDDVTVKYFLDEAAKNAYDAHYAIEDKTTDDWKANKLVVDATV